MHVCRAYAVYVCVLNQYLHSACRLSWVSQFDVFISLLMLMMMCVQSVRVYETNGETKVHGSSSPLLSPACPEAGGPFLSHSCYRCKNWTQ